MAIHALNELVIHYEEQTELYRSLHEKAGCLAGLNPENEAELNDINRCLQERAELLAQIARRQEEAEPLWQVLCNEFACEPTPAAVLAACPCHQAARLAGLHEEIRSLLAAICKLDAAAAEKLQRGQKKLREKQKKLQLSRRADRLYRQATGLSEGIFVDCKKL
ncbi:MAG: hypothetical protein GX200_07140 [Firmicutes bacterium]|nr:hypothetical protein [Bacillota bacterium]